MKKIKRISSEILPKKNKNNGEFDEELESLDEPSNFNTKLNLLSNLTGEEREEFLQGLEELF